MASVTINGRTYRGNSVSIINGTVIIDGVVQGGDETLSGVVEIRVTEGILGELRTDAAVNCREVRGNVHAGGSVNCDDVGGDVRAGGSVNCGRVHARVSAAGSITHG